MRKQLLFTLMLCSLSYFSSSQVSTWTINGNSVGSDAKIGTNTAFDLILETSNTERFRITDDGKIGIGLTSPLHKFDLLGNMRVQGDFFLTQISDVEIDYDFIGLDSDGKVVRLLESDMLLKMYSTDCRVLSGQNFPSPLWQSTGGVDFGVLHTGSVCPARVGIGTSSPLANLHVIGGGLFSSLHLGDPSVMDNANRFAITSIGGSPITLFKMTNNGEISITNNQLTGPAFSISSATNAGLIYRVRFDGGVDQVYYGNEIAYSIKDGSENDIFLIDAGGGVFCTSLHIMNVPFSWPDYVFEKNYSLLPVYELEDFLLKYHRLPNFPSADEVSTKGIEASETFVLLTEKVEELTLYMIQQQKEIDELKMLVQNASK